MLQAIEVDQSLPQLKLHEAYIFFSLAYDKWLFSHFCFYLTAFPLGKLATLYVIMVSALEALLYALCNLDKILWILCYYVILCGCFRMPLVPKHVMLLWYHGPRYGPALSRLYYVPLEACKMLRALCLTICIISVVYVLLIKYIFASFSTSSRVGGLLCSLRSQYNNSGYMTKTIPYFEMYDVQHYDFIRQTCPKGRIKFADNLKAIIHNNNLRKVPVATCLLPIKICLVGSEAKGSN